APAARTIDVSFRGSLRDALKTIADKGGLNLVVTGDLDTPAEVHLRGVTANQALRTVARAYSLRLEQDGSIFTLRPMTTKEKDAAASGDTAEAQAPAEAEQEAASSSLPSLPSMPSMPAMPPMPPMPPMPGEAAEEHAAAMREAREETREQMKRAREEMKRTRDEIRRNRRSGGRNVVARGQSLEVKEGQNVESAVVYGGNLVVNGHVEDDAVAFGGNLEVHGHVEGDAHAFGGNVILGPDARVEGDVSSFGGTVERADGAEVDGSVETFGGAGIGRMVAGEIKNGMRESRNADRDEAREDEDDGHGLAGFILTFAVLFGLGFLGQMFFPTRMKKLGDEIRRKPVQAGLTGLLGLLAMVPLTVVLCITIIGIPAAFILWMAAPLAAALGYAAVASELGTRLPLLRGRKTQAVVLALGLLVLMVVGAIPILGPLVSVLIALMAVGAVIRTRFGHSRPSGMPEPIMSSTEQPI
ncbi:hypothetical protein ACLESD_49845, partial [Pyxidicoccus sp. 3LFB2]